MKLNIKTDCGNAPKKEFIKDLTIAFASYDLDEVMPHLSDQIQWTLVGDETIVGKERFRSELEKMRGNKAVELSIFQIITHGREASIQGEMVMQNKNVFSFADFYEFTSASGKTVKAITSYVIKKS